MTAQKRKFEGIGQRILDEAPEYPRVEEIRKRLRNIDYVPVENVSRLQYAADTAIMANHHEGLVRTDEMIALDEMFMEERVPPGEITVQARKDWFSLYMSQGRG